MTRRTKTTKLTPLERTILSAIFARSNMGQGFPTKRLVESLKGNGGGLSVDSAIIAVAQQFMETDEHEGWFTEEAESWHEYLGKRGCDTVEYVAHNYPDIAELMWRDPATYVDDRRWPNG